MLRDGTSYVLTLDLKDDPQVIAAYRRHHAAIWPEVADSLREAGVRRMDIYLLGCRLVMTLEVAAGLDVRRVFERHATSHPRVAEWERLMKTFQQRAPGAGPDECWAQMERVFELREQPDPGAPGTRPVRAGHPRG